MDADKTNQPEILSPSVGSSPTDAEEDAKRAKLRKLFALAYDIGCLEKRAEELRAEWRKLSEEVYFKR